jgi:hypothetical protein
MKLTKIKVAKWGTPKKRLKKIKFFKIGKFYSAWAHSETPSRRCKSLGKC